MNTLKGEAGGNYVKQTSVRSKSEVTYKGTIMKKLSAKQDLTKSREHT